MDISAGTNLRGAGHMVLMTFSFTCGDALVRLATQDLALFQVVFLRGCLSCLFLAMLLWVTGQWRVQLSGRTKRLITLRSGAEVCAMIPFFIALTHMPFANITALLQTLPLTLTLAGALFLGEPVGWRRLAAILVGFVGVLLIVQPGGDGFSGYSLLMLLAVACLTVRDLTTRRIPQEVPVLLLSFTMAAFATAAAGVLSVTEEWQPVGTAQGGLILGASIMVMGGYTFVALAMRNGEIGFVTPFRYMALVWAVFLGFMLFGEWPDTLTWIGSSIVVATGLYTLYREQIRRRSTD
ncbi:DMT family transporter [Tropicimonas sp. S265A]|uniref:DMT family transporter n=1 Tax=Tropicimonas sp. S265A TaxID=3415134 RepID=UPI003C7A1452